MDDTARGSLDSPFAAAMEPASPARPTFSLLLAGIADAAAQLSFAAAPGALLALADVLGATRGPSPLLPPPRPTARPAADAWALVSAVAAGADALLTGRLSLGDSANGDTRLRLAELLPPQRLLSVPTSASADSESYCGGWSFGNLEAHLNARYTAVVTRGGVITGGGVGGESGSHHPSPPPAESPLPLRHVISQLEREPLLQDAISAALAGSPRQGLVVLFGLSPDDEL